MKKRHSIHVLLAAAALLLVMAACTKDELADGNRLPEGQYPLEIARITLGVEADFGLVPFTSGGGRNLSGLVSLSYRFSRGED